MSDSVLKRLEILYRKFLISSLSIFVHRDKSLPNEYPFSFAKYLFIRQDRIGDVLVSTPLFALLKKSYPLATIDVLLSSQNEFALQNNPAIRRRWIYNKRFVDSVRLLGAMRREHYDFAIDLMDNPSATSTIICLMAGARFNVGLHKMNSYIYDSVVPLLSRKDTHIVDRLLQLLSVFRIHPTAQKIEIQYSTSTSSKEMVTRFFNERNIIHRKIIGVNISAGGSVRFWGVEHYQNLLRFIQTEYPNFKVLILYKMEHYTQAEEICQPFTSAILAPNNTTFDEFAAFIERLTILITPDTSAVHLASAFNIPSVVLYVQSDKNLRIWEPYHTDCEPVVTDVDDLTTISDKSVQDAFTKILARTEANG